MAKLGEDLKVKYEPIWEQAPVDMKFHYYETLEDGTKILRIHEENFKLIDSIEELKEFAETCIDKVIAFDTETTGLTYIEDKIVGFSLSLDSYTGVYVPIRHKEQLFIEKEELKLDKNGKQVISKSGVPQTKKVTETIIKESEANLDPKQALDILYDILIKAKRVLIHNSEFDLNMMKFEGYDVNKIKSFDTLILPYLFDPEAVALAGLKALEKRVLGRTVPEFKEVLGKKYENFSLVAPKDGYVYACYDKETEVLTENGWVYWKNYNKTDKLATVNLETGCLEYQKPLKHYVYKYKGRMECCKSTHIDYCVTPNHNMVVRDKGKWILRRADELRLVEYVPTSVIYNNSRDCMAVVENKDRFQIDYDDYVYCAEVPNRTLITRRNGSTIVAGNCCDTSGVYGVFEKMYPEVRKLINRNDTTLSFDGVKYDVISKDNQLVKTFVDYYGHAKILINRQKALKYKDQLETEQKKVIEEIYTYFDKGIFNLSASSKEFKETMVSKNVFTGVKTDKGQPSWSSKASDEMKRNLAKLKECLQNWKLIEVTNGKLSKKGNGFALATILELYGKPYFNMKSTINTLTVRGINNESMDLKLFWLTVKEMYKNESEKLRILKLIQRNNSLNKALNSYVDKLTKVDECVMKYRLKGTKSGRLSSGNGSKNDRKRNHYYIDLNAQNLTKPASSYYTAVETTEDGDDCVLGWKFTPVPKDYAMAHLEDEYIVEGQDSNITIRGCLEAPKGEIKHSYVPESAIVDKRNYEPCEEPQDVFEVTLDNGKTVQCTEYSVFKVKTKGAVTYMTLHDIMKTTDEDSVEIVDV